jgi:hypothetical protein
MRRDRSSGLGLINILGFIALASWSQSSSAQSPRPPTTTPPAPQCNLLFDAVPPDPSKPLSFDPKNVKLTPVDATTKDKILTSGLPCAEIQHPDGPAQTPIENRQRGFDFYSWLTFIALNSPATNRKGIETTQPDTPTVWERASLGLSNEADSQNFMQLLDVMLPGGTRPEWGKRVIPPACQSKHALKPNLMIVKMIEESFNQPFKTGPLIDQRNNYAIFDILMNKVMFDYIVDNNLYSQAGQMSDKNSALRIDFPSGHHDPSGNGNGDPGAIMLKVSWKILDPEDDKSKFHHVQALVAMPISADQQSDPPCLERTLELVGFHVVHKTEGRPQWIWTSFEHVDNVPEQKDVEAGNLRRSYNFYDPSCSAADCPVNQTPPRPWDPEPENEMKFRVRADGKFLFNSQITRVVPLTEATKVMNGQFQSILSNTVWKNYMLIGTQWPSAFPCTADHSVVPIATRSGSWSDQPLPRTDFEKQPDMNCAPAPTFLANSTLETFSQGEIPIASSSCMACHGNATSYQRPKSPEDIYFNQSDFTFMLEKAR